MTFTAIKILREEIRQRLLRAGTISVRSEGYYADTWYRNDYRLDELEIFHSFEAPDLTMASTTFSLTKPLLILYVTEVVSERGSVDTGQVTVEFQLAVNFEPSGFITLLGYLELLRVIVNPREKGFWLSVGLAPRYVEVGPIINGETIKDTLKDRVLVASLLCDFTKIGAS
jgi:hypothetical protein